MLEDLGHTASRRYITGRRAFRERRARMHINEQISLSLAVSKPWLFLLGPLAVYCGTETGCDIGACRSRCLGALLIVLHSCGSAGTSSSSTSEPSDGGGNLLTD